MGATQTQLSTEQLLWQAYRDAFRHFKSEAGKLAEIKSSYSCDPTVAEKALLRVENARLAYNDTRDTLAAALMPPAFNQALWLISASRRREQTRVRDIAELLWELAGKPQGSADDDWYRAERVVRHVGAEAFCAR